MVVTPSNDRAMEGENPSMTLFAKRTQELVNVDSGEHEEEEREGEGG